MMMYRGGPSLRLRPKALAAGSTIILRGLILQKQRIWVGTGHLKTLEEHQRGNPLKLT